MTEVEIKLRLPSHASHQRVAQLMGPPKAVYAQENYFFDGVNDELKKQQTLRVRFYNTDQKAVITVKGRQALVGGVGRATEEEEDIDPALAREALRDPSKLMGAGSALIDNLLKQHNITELKCLGGFKNNRTVMDWSDHVIELDETLYEWGTVYEIELETDEPEKIQQKLEDFLKEHNVPFTYSGRTKFGNFRHKTLL